jgi:hypothetical protein
MLLLLLRCRLPAVDFLQEHNVVSTTLRHATMEYTIVKRYATPYQKAWAVPLASKGVHGALPEVECDAVHQPVPQCTKLAQ